MNKPVKELFKTQRESIAPLFAEWDETMVWSCLQGCMGRAWTNDSEAAAVIDIGDFCFYAGDAASPGAEELVRSLPRRSLVLLVPRDESWAALIEQVHGARAKRGVRYAIRKEGDVFDRERLRTYAQTVPEGFEVVPIGRGIYEAAAREVWSADLCSQFETYEEYREHGAGFAALHGGELAAGASSYTYYNGGIEIEIDTKEVYRRRGLALACGASLMLHCLERGLYPSWDAANLGSVALAEKLGYHFEREYPYFEIEASTALLKPRRETEC